MNIKEFRDLLEDRGTPARLRPVPLDDLHRRIRRTRLRRRVVVAGFGAATVAVAAVTTVVGHGNGRADPAAAGSAKATPPPIEDLKHIELRSRYWWNLLPNRTDLSWPKEHNERLEIHPRGQALGLFVTCRGFESNVGVTITLNGASFHEDGGHGRTTESNCFKGGLYELTIPASTKKVTVTIVARRLDGPATFGWPASRPRTWSFGVYEKGAKVPASVPATKDAITGMPGRLMILDQREVVETSRHQALLRLQQGEGGAPTGWPGPPN